MKDRNRYEKYCQNEIELAKLYLKSNPDDESQKDRLAYWSAKLGDFDTADSYASSDKCKALVNQLRHV